MDRGRQASGRDHYSRRAEHRAVQLVALLDTVENQARLLAPTRGQRLVELRIERLALRAEALDPLAFEQSQELTVNHLHAVGEVLLALARGRQSALEVVDHRQQLAHERGLRPLSRLGGLSGRAL